MEEKLEVEIPEWIRILREKLKDNNQDKQGM